MKRKLFGSISFFAICAIIMSVSLFTGCFGDDDKTDTPVTPPGDTTAPTVTSTIPAEGATVDGGNNIVIVFSEAMDTSTVTTNITGDTSCSRTVQVSSDGFETCWEFVTGSPVASVGDTTFTLGPDGGMKGSMKIKITTGAKDVAGNSLAETNISFTAF